VKSAVKLPTTTQLYESLVALHGDVGQVKYPYSSRVLKWGIISRSEIEEAIAKDPNASEQTAWAGEKTADIAARIAGGLTNYIDQEDYREKWVRAGLAEGSWKVFLETYCLLKASAKPFNNPEYYRDDEMANLLALTRILDEEVFSHAAMSGKTMLPASFKSKWWKECHKIFADSVEDEVYRSMKLVERPHGNACHTDEWNAATKAGIRKLAKRWVSSPVWDRPQSNDPNIGVDWTSNNEATVKSFLMRNKFTTHYLESRT
jgi:hypothetical protein